MQKEKETVTFRKYSRGRLLGRNTSVSNEGLPKPGREAATPRLSLHLLECLLESPESPESKPRGQESGGKVLVFLLQPAICLNLLYIDM